MRTPGFQRVEALDDLQEERDREEDPHQDQVLGEEHRHAAAQRRDLQQVEAQQRFLAAAPRAAAPSRRRAARRTPPAAITNGVSEKPNGVIGELRGASQPQLLACRTPKTRTARPAAERTLPTQSRRRLARPALGLAEQSACRAGCRSRRPPRRRRRCRQVNSVVAQPPRIGPTAMPGAGDAAEHAVGDRPLAAAVGAGDEGDHRRQDQRGADPLEDRPAEHQRGDAPGGGGQARADRVDARADREDAAAAEDVAELAAGQHQPGHHQRVEGDHRLDRRHRGVEVFDQLA